MINKTLYLLLFLLPLRLLCQENSGKQAAVLHHTIDNQKSITPAMMNGGPAFFKTYEDFVNGAGKPWVWQYNDPSGNFTREDEVVFRTEDKKKVKIPSTDFWGFRDENGFVWRNGNFSVGKITKIPFQILYIGSDHISYKPGDVGSRTVDPREWFSEDINSPIIQPKNFFMNHDSTIYHKIHKGEATCEKETPSSKSFPTMEKYWTRQKQIIECQLKSPEIICIWSANPGTKKEYPVGSYVFNKNPLPEHK